MEKFTIESLKPNNFTISLKAEKEVLDTKIAIISDGALINQLWITQDGCSKVMYKSQFIQDVIDEANDWIENVMIFS